MNHLICKFRDTLLALVVALCSSVSVPLAPASRTVQVNKQPIHPVIYGKNSRLCHGVSRNYIALQNTSYTCSTDLTELVTRSCGLIGLI